MSQLPITALNKIRYFLMCNVFSYTFINNVEIINNCDIANATEMLPFKKICTQLLIIATFYDIRFKYFL